MKFFLCSLLIINSFISIFLIIPEWNITTAGDDLLGTSTEKEILVNYRDMYEAQVKMIKKLIKNSSGSITYENYIQIGVTKRQVKFEHIESVYNRLNRYIICPRGAHHPYDFSNNVELKPNNFEGKNWNLTCYLHEVDNHHKFLLVFYHMNGNNINAYLTNTNSHIEWSDAPKIAQNQIYELYDYKLDKDNGVDSTYKMMAFLKDGTNLRLGSVNMLLKEGDQSSSVTHLSDKNQYKLKAYSEGFFSNYTGYFYFMTYNNISDFTTAFTTKEASDYTNVDTMEMKTNNLTDLEFLGDDVEIEKMRFMLSSKFLYYIFKEKKSGKRYYGIFDIEINKIIFNTAEEIITFFPLTLHSMLAITKDKAYEICTYKDSSGKCVDTCSSNHY